MSAAPSPIDLVKYLRNPTDTVDTITTNPNTAFLNNDLNVSTRQLIGVVPADFPSYPITILVTITATTQAGVGVKARQVTAGVSFTIQFYVVIVGPIIPINPPTSRGPVPSITSGGSGSPTNNPGTSTSTGNGGNGDGSSSRFPIPTSNGDDGGKSSTMALTSTSYGGDGDSSSTMAPTSSYTDDDDDDESSTMSTIGSGGASSTGTSASASSSASYVFEN